MLSLTSTKPTAQFPWAGDEQSTQKVQVHEYEKKIKPHKTFCDYIYNCKFLFFFLIWSYDTSKQSIPIHLLCLKDMQIPLPFLQDFNPLSVTKITDIPLMVKSLCPAQNV